MNPLETYLKEIQKHFATGEATEHTYRPALKTLIESLGKQITAINEPKRVACGAPDFEVKGHGRFGLLTIGHVEAKDLDKDLGAIESDSNRKNPQTNNGKQLARYRNALPNLILTNYLEFRWYVRSKKRLEARLATIPSSNKLKPVAEGAEEVSRLLESFILQEPEPIADPKDLALHMANLAHLIRDIIVEAFNTGNASPILTDLHKAFEETLIPELETSAFADMFAQTLAYGLFAARCTDPSIRPGQFTRDKAAHLIPKTNPFLRKLFSMIAGPEMDEEPYEGHVNDLRQLLGYAEMDKVLTNFGKREKKQDPVLHFYETFLTAYNPTERKRRGVYYTPEPVVSYIVRSVDYLLRTRFNCPDGLADTSLIERDRTDADGNKVKEKFPRVLILDPACGTGTFLYAIVDLIRAKFMAEGRGGEWSSYVREHLLPRLFGFELLMAPYAVAHFKLGMQLAGHDLPSDALRDQWAYDFEGAERLGIYLTNTLEQAARKSEMLFARFITQESEEAARIKRDIPIMVVLGNPPYAGHSANRSWEIDERGKKVRTFIGQLLQGYYYVDGNPLGERNPKWLQDDYVKFIRFGQWRIERTGAGILAFITNHGYLDNPTFRGMRQQLMKTFDEIYVLDLHGNAKKKEVCPDGSKDENVFDIQQGVAIALMVKLPR
ncbi:MAG: N-6 DNA methylase [bacterium]|nr:N-6 DNA methylase [bacterium]